VLGHQGCSVHIREFTDALVEAGHDVFILCAWLGEALDIQTKARIYHVQPTGHNEALWRGLYEDPEIQNHFLDRDLRSVLWNTWLQTEGAVIFNHEKPDFLYERYALFGVGGLELSRRYNLPLILELNAPLCDQQEGYQRFPLIQTARQLEPHIICNADATVALTDWLADWAIGLGACPENVHVLPDAVSDVRFGGQISNKRVREELGLTDSKVVGFVGSFHKWHDLAGLIEAFSMLSVAEPALRLLLVGDGHDRKKCQKQVHNLGLDETVVFVGNVPHSQVPEYLAAMDVAVVPYRPMNDFFFSPMKLFESMAVGCPTIAADLGQISEVVRHQETGWLYTPGDNRKLAEGIARLLDDSPLAERIGAAAREYVLAHHTWRHVTSEVVRIAGELLKR
jgi:glycosyltransferase involved in cell wall biosynthesis